MAETVLGVVECVECVSSLAEERGRDVVSRECVARGKRAPAEIGVAAEDARVDHVQDGARARARVARRAAVQRQTTLVHAVEAPV